LTIPPTPPPDIDLEAWHESIELIAAWAPRRLAVTHFGETEDVSGQLMDVGSRLDSWAELARGVDQRTFIERIRAEIEREADPATALAFVQAAPPEQLYAGLERYWRKRMDAPNARPHRDRASLS
jgi:hypothetical protein